MNNDKRKKREKAKRKENGTTYGEEHLKRFFSLLEPKTECYEKQGIRYVTECLQLALACMAEGNKDMPKALRKFFMKELEKRVVFMAEAGGYVYDKKRYEKAAKEI